MSCGNSFAFVSILMFFQLAIQVICGVADTVESWRMQVIGFFDREFGRCMIS